VSAPNIFDVSKYAGWFTVLCVAVLVVLGIIGRNHSRTVELGTVAYNLDVANNSAERAKGLGGREQLDNNSGMLFVFDGMAERCFWMKDMRFSIDIVWTDQAKRVTHIEQRVSPKTYPKALCADAKFVLELPAGAADRGRLRTGDALTF